MSKLLEAAQGRGEDETGNSTDESDEASIQQMIKKSNKNSSNNNENEEETRKKKDQGSYQDKIFAFCCQL